MATHSLGAGGDVRNSSLALADQIVTSAANFLTGVIVGRSTTQDEFGLYMLGLSIVTVGLLVQNSLISSPYMVYGPRLSVSERAIYSGSALCQQAAVSLAATLILAIVGVGLSFGSGPAGLAALVATLAIVVGLLLLREFARRMCFANLRFRTALVLDLAIGIAQIAGLLTLAGAGAVTANRTFGVLGLSSAAVCLWWLTRSCGGFAFDRGSLLSDLRRNWIIGRWLFASALLWESNVILYPWLLAYFHGTGSTGVWAACFGVIALANPVMLGMQNVVGPQMSHSYAHGGVIELRRVVARSTSLFTFLVLPIALTVGCGGGWLIVLFYGDQYGDNGLVVIPLALEMLIAPTRFNLSRAIVIMGRSDVDFASNGSSLIVVVLFGVWITRLLGPLGVAVGILTGSSLVTVTKYAAYRILLGHNTR